MVKLGGGNEMRCDFPAEPHDPLVTAHRKADYLHRRTS